MDDDINGNKTSFIDILEMIFIPFKPLIEKTKNSQSMQTGLTIASIVVYIIPIIFYLATKNIFIALVPWIITVWIIKRICDDFAKPKFPPE